MDSCSWIKTALCRVNQRFPIMGIDAHIVIILFDEAVMDGQARSSSSGYQVFMTFWWGSLGGIHQRP